MMESGAARRRMSTAMQRSISERVAVLYGRELEQWNRRRPVELVQPSTLRSTNQIS